MLLAALAAFAAQTWTPTCASESDPTAWWVLEAKKPAAIPDFLCNELFLDGLPCPRVVAVATLRWKVPEGRTLAVPELKYLPYAQTADLLAFLDRDEGGVKLENRLPVERPGADVLFKQWVEQRQRASQAWSDVVLHLWTCPAANPVEPEAWIPLDVPVRRHYGRPGVMK